MVSMRVPFAGLCLVVVGCAGGCTGGTGAGPATTAEVEVLRPSVTLGGRAIAGTERVGGGGEVAVGEGGRAWLRHDNTLRLLIDGSAKGTQLVVEDDGVKLTSGRVFAEAQAPARLHVGDVTLDVRTGAFELRQGDGVHLYVARGVVAWSRSDGSKAEIHAGEEAVFAAGAPKVSAAVLWDDWTGGLGWPEAGGPPRRGFGEIGARKPGSLGEARFPLAITRLEVRARIEDDEAVTRVVQTFFNPASDTLEGLYRVRIPEGAILRRFAIDRDGRWADGYVKERETARKQYQAQVYEGSTLDPALLEWEAPGSFRARIYPIPAGATRKILVEYSEWLTPSGPDSTRSYRYPMAGGGSDVPLLEELDVEIDAAQAGAKTLRAGLSARIEGQKVILARTDFRPTSDFVVDLVGPARSAKAARGYRAQHRVMGRITRGEDDYYLLRVVPLLREAVTERAPLDVIVLTDVSAGTDATHLQLARTTVEALLRHLDAKDRVAVLGADLELRRPGAGKPELVSAARASLDTMLDGLARQGVGGATDLGAVLTAAAAMLDPTRRGVVIYVGDAMPTVGELDLKTLRERLDRLPAPLRLYGVAIGDESDLGLLESLTAGAGLSLRVGDRGAAAGAALRIIGHAQRRAVDRVTVDLGSGLDRVYPRRAVTVVEGEALEVLGRVRAGVPKSVTLTGHLFGKPWTGTWEVDTHNVGVDDDLRLRWASERLRQLLADGASAEEVAELGTRQNLITPFTSFYVPSAGELSLLEAAMPEVRSAGCSYKSAPMSRSEAPPPSPVSLPVGTPSAGEMVAPSADTTTAQPAPTVPAAEPMAAPTTRAKSAGYHAEDEDAKVAANAPEATVDGRFDRSGAAGGLAGPRDKSKEEAPDQQRRIGSIGGRGNAKDLDNLLDSSPPAAAKPSPGYGMGSGSGKGGKNKAGFYALGGAQEKQPNKKSSADNGLLGALHGSSGQNLASVFGRSSLESERRGDDGDSGRDRLLIRISIYGHRALRCSPAAALSSEDRRSLWKERLTVHGGVDGAMEVWQDALAGCELKTWGDRRALLLSMLTSVHAAPRLVQLYNRFSDDDGAQDFMRRAILGLVKTAADLRTVVDGLGVGEDAGWSVAQSLVAKAATPTARLAVLDQLAAKWPQQPRLRLLRMEAYEQAGRLEDALRLADEVRTDPYADAQARTLVGELLARHNDEPGARRAFSEIVEFAPKDPQARRRLGDLYRAHGWYEEAYRQYQTLSELLPNDPSVLVLLASAAAGAGRTDEALRLEQRAAEGTEPGSETGVAKVARWWSSVRLLFLRQEARDKHDDAELARVWGRTRRANVLADARPFRVYLLWAHPEADCELSATLPGNIQSGPTELAPEFGLSGVSSREALQGDATVEIRRSNPQASLRYTAQLLVIWDEGQKTEASKLLPLELGPQGQPIKVRITPDRKAEVLK